MDSFASDVNVNDNRLNHRHQVVLLRVIRDDKHLDTAADSHDLADVANGRTADAFNNTPFQFPVIKVTFGKRNAMPGGEACIQFRAPASRGPKGPPRSAVGCMSAPFHEEGNPTARG